MNSNRQHGFTLLELSIVLIIIGLVMAGSVSIGSSMIEQAKENQTRAKMKSIEAALLNYRKLYNRLPCPNQVDLPYTDANYGKETDSDGAGGASCAGVSGNPFKGAIPAKALGLPVETMLDGWGGKFVYTLSDPYAEHNAFTTQNITSSAGIIQMIDYRDEKFVLDAVYALISYGKNGHCATLPTGSMKTGSATALETMNCDAEKVRTGEISRGALSADGYDDITLYKLRLNLVGSND